MKRGTKITLWVVGSCIALYLFAQVGLDSVASYFVDKEIRQAIENSDMPYIIDYGHVFCLTSTGVVMVTDLHFVNDTVLPDGSKEAVEVRVNRVQVELDYYRKIWRQKQVSLRKITVTEPQITLWTAPKPPTKPKRQQLQEQMHTTIQAVADTIQLPQDEKVKKWIRQVSVASVVVENGSLQWKEIGTHMHMNATGVESEVKHLTYDMEKDTFTYCDSLYTLQVGNWKMTAPDGLIQVEANNIHTQDGGEIHIGATHVGHTVPKKQLGHILKEPTTWIDMYVNSITIAETNLFRTDWTKGVDIPLITADVERFETVRDNRHDPKRPFQMPQVFILQIPYPIRLNQIDVAVKRLDVAVMETDKNIGKFSIHHATATVCDFCNRRNSRMEAVMAATVGSGKVNMTFHMTMDRACHWDVLLKGKNIEVSALNPLIRPLVAIEVNCHVDSIKAKYKGNKVKADGTFMLAYTGISAKVYRNQPIPYRQISQNAGAIEYFINNLVPKSNPKYAGKPASVYSVEWVWKPEEEAVPMFMCGPLIMGAVQTYLPGLFVGKKIKTKDIPRDYRLK